MLQYTLFVFCFLCIANMSAGLNMTEEEFNAALQRARAEGYREGKQANLDALHEACVKSFTKGAAFGRAQIGSGAGAGAVPGADVPPIEHELPATGFAVPEETTYVGPGCAICRGYSGRENEFQERAHFPGSCTLRHRGYWVDAQGQLHSVDPQSSP